MYLATTGSGHLEFILITLVVFFVAAKVFSAACEAIRVPGIVGELCAGILLGNLPLLFPGLQSWRAAILHSDFFHISSELGVIFLLFVVGLETSLADMRRVGRHAALVAVIGVVMPFGLGYLSGSILPGFALGFTERIFLGAALTATSVGITAKVLHDTNALKTAAGQTILGAAVIDDILGLMILAVVSGLATGADLTLLAFATILGKVLLFFGLVLGLGRYVIPLVIQIPARWHGSAMMLTTALFIMFFLAWGAAKLGLAPIVGAFMAGLLMDERYFHSYREASDGTLEHFMGPITALFLPLFFVVLGIQVDLAALASGPTLLATLLLTAVAVVGKIISGVGMPRRLGGRWVVGFGMIPRGEVGLVFAAVGLASGAISPNFYGVIVLVVALTTMVAPILLRQRLALTAA